MSTFANPLTEYTPQMEAFEFSSGMELGQESGGVFNVGQEMELDYRSVDAYTIPTFSCENGLCHSQRSGRS